MGRNQKKRVEKEQEFFMSDTNIRTLNYKVYYLNTKEKFLYGLFAFAIGAAVGYLFYGGIGKDEFNEPTIVTYVLNILIPTIVGIIAAVVYLPIRTEQILDKRKKALNSQFKDMLDALSTSLGAGKNVIDSFLAIKDDLKIQYETDSIESWLDKTDEELSADITNTTVSINNSVTASFDSLIQRQSDIVMQKITTLIENAVEEGNGDADTVAAYVVKNLGDWPASELGNESADSLAYNIKLEAISMFKDTNGQYIKDLYNAIHTASIDATTAASNNLNKVFANIRTDITSGINGAGSKVNQYKSQMTSAIKNSVSEGADKLRETINNQIDGVFGSSSAGANDVTGMSSLLSFQYSDYLKLFLMVGLLTNEDTLLLRTADVIQVNMANKLTSNNKYLLKNSAVYVKIEATIQVKPLLISLPLFSKVENNPKDNTKWYMFKYSNVSGY